MIILTLVTFIVVGVYVIALHRTTRSREYRRYYYNSGWHWVECDVDGKVIPNGKRG